MAETENEITAIENKYTKLISSPEEQDLYDRFLAEWKIRATPWANFCHVQAEPHGRDHGAVMSGDYNADDGSPKIGVYGSIVEMVDAVLKNHVENAQHTSRKTQRAVCQGSGSHAAGKGYQRGSPKQNPGHAGSRRQIGIDGQYCFLRLI